MEGVDAREVSVAQQGSECIFELPPHSLPLDLRSLLVAPELWWVLGRLQFIVVPSSCALCGCFCWVLHVFHLFEVVLGRSPLLTKSWLVSSPLLSFFSSAPDWQTEERGGRVCGNTHTYIFLVSPSSIATCSNCEGLHMAEYSQSVEFQCQLCSDYILMSHVPRFVLEHLPRSDFSTGSRCYHQLVALIILVLFLQLCQCSVFVFF